MKKVLGLLSLGLFLLGNSQEAKGFFGSKKSNEKVIKVGATPVPHAELLEEVRNELLEKGYELEIVEFTDYITPNLALDDDELDANFFQHIPYLKSFSEDRGLDIVSAGSVHVEPIGVYSNKVDSLEKLKDGAVIAIPNDPSNGARSLILLEQAGLIEIDKKAGLKATEFDIVSNPRKFKFKALEAAGLPRVLQDVDAAIINGNYALEANLNPVKDSILLEGEKSPYANIVAVKSNDLNSSKTRALIEALQSEVVEKFIEKTYNGGVVPAF